MSANANFPPTCSLARSLVASFALQIRLERLIRAGPPAGAAPVKATPAEEDHPLLAGTAEKA